MSLVNPIELFSRVQSAERGDVFFPDMLHITLDTNDPHYMQRSSCYRGVEELCAINRVMTPPPLLRWRKAVLKIGAPYGEFPVCDPCYITIVNNTLYIRNHAGVYQSLYEAFSSEDRPFGTHVLVETNFQIPSRTIDDVQEVISRVCG